MMTAEEAKAYTKAFVPSETAQRGGNYLQIDL